MTVTAYYDRDIATIDGLFTVRDVVMGKVVKEFVKLPARSGQRGYENTSWIRGKSPIPWGNHQLWLGEKIDPWKSAGRAGIGHFIPIGTDLDKRSIISEDGAYIRKDIGLHPENLIPGSAGCIVLIESARMWEMFKYLDTVSKSTKLITLVVL